jgi:hypothetical protein
MKTISDLEDYYGGAETGEGAELINRDDHREEEEKIVERSIQVSLTLREDFSQKCVFHSPCDM